MQAYIAMNTLLANPQVKKEKTIGDVKKKVKKKK